MCGHLGALVAARNVRRIVVHVTRPTARELREARASQQALDLLQAHGFSIRFCVRDDLGQNAARQAWPNDTTDSHDKPNWVQDGLGAIHIVEDGLVVRDIASTLQDAGDLQVPLPSPSAKWTNRLQGIAADILGFTAMLEPNVRLFGTHLVSARQVFYESALSFCLVNLKPIVPGHVLVIPKRRVDRFSLLAADEVADLWRTAQLTGSVIQRQYAASSLTFTIQDGPEAGQTVPHVHIHVIPRRAGDFDVNDDVYAEIEAHERGLRGDHAAGPRRARSLEVMAAEAALLRGLCPPVAAEKK